MYLHASCANVSIAVKPKECKKLVLLVKNVPVNTHL